MHALRTGTWALGVVLTAPFAWSDVLEVDPLGGGDFVSIAAAVAAADDGDVLIVQDGSYGSFTIDGKSLVVTAEAGASVRVPRIAVSGLAADQRVVLSRIDSFVAPTFFVQGCEGPVWAQHCAFSDGTSMNVYHGAEAHTSGDVLVHHCTLTGGSATIDEDGGHGMLLFGESRVAAWQSAFTAGVGGRPGLSGLPGLGGHGLHVKALAEFYAMGAIFTGALGGETSPPSADGPGVLAAPEATVRLVGSTSVGAGAAPDQVGPVRNLSLTPRDLTGPSLAREGEALTLHASGVPGDVIYLARSRDPGHLYLPSARGVLALGAPFLVGPPQGTLGASGQLSLDLIAPALAAGAENGTFYYQLLVVTAGGKRVLGTPLALEVVDPAF